MTLRSPYEAALAGVACAAFLAYVLACASFSPDGRQVLYPAYGAATNQVELLVYDRETGQSAKLFSADPLSPDEYERELCLLRAGWLPDGKHILVAQPVPQPRDALALFLIRADTRQVVRRIGPVPGKQIASLIAYPFAATEAFVLFGFEDELIRVDLASGKADTAANPQKLLLLPGCEGASLLAAVDRKEEPRSLTLGLLDPQTLAFQALVTVTNKFEGMPAFSPRERLVVYPVKADDEFRIEALKDGRTWFSRVLGSETNGAGLLALGPLMQLGPKRDRVFTSFMRGDREADEAEYGVVEIPFAGEAVRWIALFRGKVEDDILIFTQPALSRDGQAFALSTTYCFAEDDDLNDDACALYVVDVKGAAPKVAKVPVPLPLKRAK